MSGSSLDAAYFDGIFGADDDPWDLATSKYEAAKFQHTRAVLADRRYNHALEVGCAHGVLTKQLIGLCDTLLAVDISTKALANASQRIGDQPGLTLQRMAFPRETPIAQTAFDLVILSEVAYYWAAVDLDRAAQWLRASVAPHGRIILVHYTGETDYPQSGDQAVKALWAQLGSDFAVAIEERRDRYRLDLWEKR